MENNNSRNKKIEIKIYQDEKHLFLNLLKDDDDILLIKKNENNYINKLKNAIKTGLTILDKTEIVKKKLNIKKNSNYKVNNNSKNNILLSSEKFGIFKNNYLNQKSMPTTPNTNNKIKKYFKLKDKVRKKLFILNDRNYKRIQSSRTNKIINNKINNYFKSENYLPSKNLNISPYSSRNQNSPKNYTYNMENNKNKPNIINNRNKKKVCNLNNFSSNNLLKSHRILSSNKVLKPSFLLSDEEREPNIELLNKEFKIENKVKNTFNNTILKFDRNKLKFHSYKKIKKKIQILSERKISHKKKESMKEYYDIKKIFDVALRKKKKNTSDIKSSSLYHKGVLNKKNIYYKKAIRKYFSRPNREMKHEFTKNLKNRYFVVDTDNNPYKFRVFNSIYN